MALEKRFEIRTYGCQMNVHDSQKVANLLHHSGFEAASPQGTGDLLIINTCSIRHKAENQLYSDLGALRVWKQEKPGRVLGVGGCVAQQVGDSIMSRFPHVDFVFGTHNLRWVPSMIAAAERGERISRTDESRSLERFDLPALHPDGAEEAGGRAFVTVMEGCDMFCTFCIVPTTRGREISRPAGAIEAEVTELVARGIREVTLLGQTVNAYGRHDARRGHSDGAGTVPFATLLRRLDAIPGLERIRYTSPHPLFFDDDLIRCHGELERLCPHVHLPLQSGSDAILERMRRRYDSARFLEIVEGLRAARPDLAITSDLIVGYPGESESEFEDTLAIVRKAGFVDSFSFKYSPRPGTAAAEHPDRIPGEEAQRRLEALQQVQRGQTLAYHRSRVGGGTQILVEGEARRPGQVRGLDPYHRVVNLDAGRSGAPAPGDLLSVEIVEATPHSLIGETLGGEAKSPHLGPENRAHGLKPDPRSAEEKGRSAGLGDSAEGLLRIL